MLTSGHTNRDVAVAGGDPIEHSPDPSRATTKTSGILVVPGVTDMNRGDQALVWETVSVALESAGAETVTLVDSGHPLPNSGVHAAQTRARGFTVVRSLLRDPRRGRTLAADHVRETPVSLLLLAVHAVADCLATVWTLVWARWPRVAKWVLDSDRKATFDLLNSSRALFVKGGGFLHAHGELRAPYYIWYQLYYMRLAHRLGVPVYVMPNSFGPFRGLGVAKQMRRVLARCRFVAARETASSDALGELLGRHIPVYPDLGYFLTPAPLVIGERICRDAGIPLYRQRCAAVTVRPWRFPGPGHSKSAYDQYLDAMARLIQHIAARGVHAVLCAHVLGPSAHENDNLAIDDLEPRLGGTGWTRLDHRGDCAELQAVYGLMNYVIGTRFHSVVFAQAMGVPCLAIAYGGNKGSGIMKDMGLAEFVVPIERLSAQELCARFDRLMALEDEVRRTLVDYRARAQAQRQAMVDLLRADGIARVPPQASTMLDSGPGTQRAAESSRIRIEFTS